MFAANQTTLGLEELQLSIDFVIGPSNLTTMQRAFRIPYIVLMVHHCFTLSCNNFRCYDVFIYVHVCWLQLEKEFSKKSKHKSNNNNSNASRRVKKASHDRNIRFVSSVMLLEAASRNAVDEGKNLATSTHSYCVLLVTFLVTSTPLLLELMLIIRVEFVFCYFFTGTAIQIALAATIELLKVVT